MLIFEQFIKFDFKKIGIVVMKQYLDVINYSFAIVYAVMSQSIQINFVKSTIFHPAWLQFSKIYLNSSCFSCQSLFYPQTTNSFTNCNLF